ncbi:probable phytol kinase 2, chloroplastic [Magnolia sinica]|uniref:probable phytol kinase 2, chloroplastic n=1 Tax=Magnolia sinica TaxID=86752 RepID=UPI002658EB0C|nr:probable phytol kinase 2, chloroplastic [Magnolia sinica]
MALTPAPTKHLYAFSQIPSLPLPPILFPPKSRHRQTRCSSSPFPCCRFLSLSSSSIFPPLPATSASGVRRDLTSLTASMPPESVLFYDIGVAVLVSGVALLLLRFWAEIAKRRLLEEKLNRKLVHISVGLVFMLFWPLFSSRREAAILAALAPGVNIIRMLLLGLGIWKNEALVKSISRHGGYRELLKGPLYYACTITLATSVFWRTSPIAIAAICNLCAGDGMADIIGRRFGSQKLPYNCNKSIAGSIAMGCAGFIASLWYMHYFSLFGLIEESWRLIAGFFVVSAMSAVVESLPISAELDDNLTVPLTSLLVGSLVF